MIGVTQVKIQKSKSLLVKENVSSKQGQHCESDKKEERSFEEEVVVRPSQEGRPIKRSVTRMTFGNHTGAYAFSHTESA